MDSAGYEKKRGLLSPRRWVLVLLEVIMLGGLWAFAGGTAQAADYQRIDQETARQMMAVDDGHVIVDVRRPDEYAAGHIPGAILIPNETIGSVRPAELADLNQIILIYCRSGNRSKQAAQKLSRLGYTKIYEFGGINTWSGDIEIKKK